MLINIIGNFGIFAAMTYYNIKLGSIRNKKEIQRNIMGMILFFVTEILLLEYVNPISNVISFILSILFYVLIINKMTKRNVFFLLFEYIYYIMNTMLAQMAFFIFYFTPTHMTLEQFGQSLFARVVLSVFSVLTYSITSRVVGKSLFRFKETIWTKYKKEIKYFNGCLILFLIWCTLIDEILHIFTKGPMKEEILLFNIILTICFIIVSIGGFLVSKNFMQKKVILDLEDIANIDEMTGVLNRRAGLSYLQNEINNQGKEKGKLIVGYVDINYLKQVNDTMGHATGDQLICHVANHLRQYIDPVHWIIRMGGDEFLIVFKNVVLEDAKKQMTSLLEHVNDEKPDSLREVEISFSFGFSEFDHSTEQLDYEEVIQKADQEMYQHKMRYKRNLSSECQ